MNSADESRLKVEVVDRLATVTIDFPERRNALDRRTMDEFAPLFLELGERDDIWVVLITGAGDEAFCAGRDLKSADSGSHGARMPTLGSGMYAFEAVRTCPKPVVAAINGWALGGGFELALACDLRVASEHAQLGMPEARLGLGGQFAGVMLPRLVPAAVANEILYFGEPISAGAALGCGLVSRVFPAATFRADVAEYATRLVARAPLTLRRFKALDTLTRTMPVQAALVADPHPNPYVSEDAREGLLARREKRAPQWTAR